MKSLLTLLSLVGAFGFPFISSAATYHYVDMRGVVQSIEAASPGEALVRAAQTGDIIHSGVAIDAGILSEGEYVGNYYQYRATDSSVRHVFAATLDAAYVLATDRDPSSGMLLLEDAST